MANKIDEIRKRLKDATPGPWEYVPADDCDDWQLYNGEFTFIKQDDSGVPVSTEDGEFIANAPTDIDFLLGEVSRLKAELERAKEQSNFWQQKEREMCSLANRSLNERDALKVENEVAVRDWTDVRIRCQRLEAELAAAKGEIVKDNEEYAKRDKRAGEECARLKLLAESYRSTLAEIAALTSENGCVEMAADMAQSVLNEDER